jgi:hypothetical protein
MSAEREEGLVAPLVEAAPPTETQSAKGCIPRFLRRGLITGAADGATA